MLRSTLRRGFAAKAIGVAGVVLAVAMFGASGAGAAAGGTDRPISGDFSGVSIFDLPTGAVTQDGTAIESHLGRVTVHITGLLIPTGPNTFDISATGTSTAANGDQVFYTVTGTGTTDATGATQGQIVLTITGGTGRFTDVSGSKTGPFSSVPISATATTTTSALTSSWSGTISY